MRYEGQVRQRQQRELADTVIGRIQKELENPKVLQQILQQSVSDVERESSGLVSALELTGIRHRGGQAPAVTESTVAIPFLHVQTTSILLCAIRQYHQSQ